MYAFSILKLAFSKRHFNFLTPTQVYYCRPDYWKHNLMLAPLWWPLLSTHSPDQKVKKNLFNFRPNLGPFKTKNQLLFLPYFLLACNFSLFTYLGPINYTNWQLFFGLRGRTCASEVALPRRSSLPVRLSASISVTQIVIILTLWIICGPGQLNLAATKLRAKRSQGLPR